MYRAAEVRLFKTLSAIGDTFAIIAVLSLIGHFMALSFATPLREISLISLVFSGFFKLQIFMYKVTIMEKRLLHLVEPSLQHFRIASRWSTVHLVVYFIFFWTVLIGLVFSIFP